MGQAKSARLLAFSAILALGSMSGWTKPASPDRPSPPGILERASGRGDRAGNDPRVVEPSEAGGKDGEAAGPKGRDSLKPAQRPARPEAEEETPAREEKTDCDDCVIVLGEGAGEPEGRTAGTTGMAGSGHLAGTLWGLFMVARPKRMPRTIIRGVTVP